MGGGKRTRERALPKILDPLWKEETGQTEQRHPRGVENVPYEGGPKPLFGRGVIREVEGGNRKNRATTPEGGGKCTVRGGSKTPFPRTRFSPPS